MYETKTQIRLNWWPAPQDYNEAIQIPRANLYDLELQNGLVYTDAIGLPRPVTGSFASVYRMHCPAKDFALRLFLRNISDQEQRYALISNFVQNDDLPYTVTFHFLKSGIKIMGEWLPALKMEWVDGVQFDDYIVENLNNPTALGVLADNFRQMMDDLHKAGIAHGDLQHGNIIICAKELRLVDYDGMFVPAMHGLTASELGHRNYQHPQRAARHFGPYLDNFSAWVIYASVRALQLDHRLLHQLGGGDDCLLFRQKDFLDPLHSPAFKALEGHLNPELNKLGRFIRAQLKKDLCEIPHLQLPVPDVLKTELDPLSVAAPAVRSGAKLVPGNLPDWLSHDNQEMLSGSPGGRNLDHLAPEAVQPSWVVPAKPAASLWVRPTAVQAGQSPGQPTTALTQIPPELLACPGQRKLKYVTARGRYNPELLQCVMLLNPLLWFLFYFIIAAPETSGLVIMVLLAVIVILEISIWSPALRDENLANCGTAAVARIKKCRIDRASDGGRHYQVDISYLVYGETIEQTVPVSEAEYPTFTAGSAEIILCKLGNAREFVFYRFCRYHAVP